MTTETIATMVGEMAEAINGDFNYLMFPENSAPDPPYILFYYPRRNDFLADDVSYQVITQLNIELYTSEKDFDKESAIEAILRDYGIIFSKDEAYQNDEKLFEILYTMEVCLNV
jgi:hypothetical protein